MLPLKLYSLGGLSISRGDHPVGGFVSRKVEALLVYLAYERREHQRESLATLLWDDLSQERALGNLRTALSNLTAQLDEYLLINRQTVMMNPEAPCWIDATALLEAFRAAGDGTTPASARELAAAVELYKGEFLAGFHLRGSENFDKWRMIETDRIQGHVLGALHRLVRYALEYREYETGISHARRALSIDPLNEEAHRSLILLLARSGQRGAALAQYDTCVRLLREELGVEPEPETTELLTRIQSEQMSTVTLPRPVTSLPVPSTPFIDRPGELQQIAERLTQPDCRLLTIVGPGGMGKTRLAMQTAVNMNAKFRDGVYYVPLATVQQGEFIPLEIARALGFSPQGVRDPVAELIGYLSGREVLIVLDNFEHLVEHAEVLSALLSHAAEVRMLVTSRVWLNLPEEWGMPVEGMSYPLPHAPNPVSYESVQLFVSCARRVSPRFSLEGEIDAVATICRLVEGMPLSIELAAAWLKVIPPAEIVRNINLKFLSTSARGISERHRSAEAVFDYSWKMLSPTEAEALMKLSVFKSIFDREAALKIAGAALPILASLVEKSLIRRVDSAHYSIHELLRQYAFERLTAAGVANDVRTAHLTYYVELTSDPDSRIHGEQQTDWLEYLEREHDNLRTAMSWALERSTPEARDLGLRLGASIWEFWLMRSHITEGRQWLGLLLEATKGTISEARGAATQGAGYLAWIQGESDQAEALHREGLAIREAIGDKAGMGGSLSNLGIVAWGRGDFAAARDFYEQALAVRREANYDLGVASVLNNLSLLMQDQSEYESAIAYAEQAWAMFKQLDDLQGMVHILYNISAMTFDRGDVAGARKNLEEALELARYHGDQRVIGGLLLNLGVALTRLGEIEKARTYLDESLSLVMQINDRQHIGLAKGGQAVLALTENRTSDALRLIDEGLPYLREPKGDVYLGQALITKGQILSVRGEYVAATAIFREALDLLSAIKKPQPIADALYSFGITCLRQGNLTDAAALIGLADWLAEKYQLRFAHHEPQIDRTVIPAVAKLDARETDLSTILTAVSEALSAIPH
ncbi:MAG: tetratricopeptide repeat protein [Anaerolineae bacterium]